MGNGTLMYQKDRASQQALAILKLVYVVVKLHTHYMSVNHFETSMTVALVWI